MRRLKSIAIRIYVVALMAFTLWYGHFIYPLIFGFEGKQAAAESLKHLTEESTQAEWLFARLLVEQEERRVTDLGYRVIEQPYIEGRFHHLGFARQQDRASSCVPCHGVVPHHESREIRSFLNMHAYFLACETCHVPPAADSPAWRFRWYDKDTGEIAANPRALLEIEESYRHGLARAEYPLYGDYGAKIAPGRVEGERFSFLWGRKDREFAERYVDQRELLEPERMSQVDHVIHRGIEGEPVACERCHQSAQPYLPLAELGYPPRRIAELGHNSVVGMIEKYKEFYIPGLLTPGRHGRHGAADAPVESQPAPAR